MDKQEIKACAGRIEWPGGQYMWLETPTCHAVLHTTYVDDEPRSWEGLDGLPVTDFPTGSPRYRLHLPRLVFGPAPLVERPVLSVQLWEIRGDAMWRWAFPEWRPSLSEEGKGTAGDLAVSRAWSCGRADVIEPASLAT